MDRSGGPFLLPAAVRFGRFSFSLIVLSSWFRFSFGVVSDRVRLRFLVAVSCPVHPITERFFRNRLKLPFKRLVGLKRYQYHFSWCKAFKGYSRTFYGHMRFCGAFRPAFLSRAGCMIVYHDIVKTKRFSVILA